MHSLVFGRDGFEAGFERAETVSLHWHGVYGSMVGIIPDRQSDFQK